jgi:ATP-dependent RNA helicase SUPV3L1/SUV3
MTKLVLTPETVVEILARIPEGFIHRRKLVDKRSNGVQGDAAVQQAIDQHKVGRTQHFVYDLSRTDQQTVEEMAAWCHPAMPVLSHDGKFALPSVWEQRKRRERQFSDPIYTHIFDLLRNHQGYVAPQHIAQIPNDQPILWNLVHAGALDQIDDFIYDPLMLSATTMEGIIERQRYIPVRDALVSYLSTKPGQTAPVNELAQRFSAENLEGAFGTGGFNLFSVQAQDDAPAMEWVRLNDADAELALQIASRTLNVPDEAWENVLPLAGDVRRDDMHEGTSARIRVLARSYNVRTAAHKLGLSEEALSQALHNGRMSAFTDPDGVVRIAAADVQTALDDPAYLEQITSYEVVKIREIGLVLDMPYPAVRKRMYRAKINKGMPLWGEVRGRWGLPDTYHEFKSRLTEHTERRRVERVQRQEAQELAVAEERRRLHEQRERDRRERDELRAKLVAAFPTWRHDGRSEQRITIHVGPPNSGKTHQALDALANAENGWYLAPLRLLAFEIFDRLNRRGVLCNLLTGEEYIGIPGATITAATIEMFDPRRSGEVVVVDEAQMLADPDRGWAWTRAIMEAQAPEIRIICPPTARDLIEHMARAAAIPFEVVEHGRLAPIRVAEKSWTLRALPPRTILVAFSRQSVLHLKTELERSKRSVSVIYGNLPPEVRRKQADRFANGQTDICIATDAVGMGLNLPADHVCFYELQKFDGKKVRTLTPSEVQQIGGRAGRYGLSEGGIVGALNKRDLNLVRELFSAPQSDLTHARVAPSVDDLELIPGHLADKLAQWASLQSVPDSLRSAIKTADLGERIELARMLTDAEIAHLGLATALKLINAPTRQSTRAYWYQCARRILSSQPMPVPPHAPESVTSSTDLELIESCVSCADIYLWLSQRPEFAAFAPDAELVRFERTQWSERIDEALLERLDTAKRCVQCGRPLSASYRYSTCDQCYHRRFDADTDDIEVEVPSPRRRA